MVNFVFVGSEIDLEALNSLKFLITFLRQISKKLFVKINY